MTGRARLSATVEAGLLKAARRAVAEGRADSVSAWVNGALQRQAEHDRRMKALDEAVRAYEAERGVITEEDTHEAERYYRGRSVRVGSPAHADARRGSRRRRMTG